MRSCSMALQLAATACGGFAASALLSGVADATARRGRPWFPEDLNSGRLDLFFLLLAALMLTDFLVFVFVASRYTYKRVPHVADGERPPPLHTTTQPHPPLLPRVPSLARLAAANSAAAAAAASAATRTQQPQQPPPPMPRASSPISFPAAVRAAAGMPRALAQTAGSLISGSFVARSLVARPSEGPARPF